MEMVRRVHVAPLGFEYDRILEPARRYGADVVYLLAHEGGPRPAYHDRLIEELAADGIEVETRSVDLMDVYDVLGAVTTIAAGHDGDDVRVNVSSGNALSAVGATIACMDVSTDATAYYVHPEARAHDGAAAPRTSGYASDDTLPTYPIDSPTPDQVAVLRYLGEATTAAYTPKKKDVIDHAKEVGLPFLVDNPPANRQGEFRRLNASVIDPLLDDGLIEVRSVGRRKEVTVTDRGEQALRAFRHKLDGSVEGVGADGADRAGGAGE
jgi:hypothetical protein